MDNYNENCQSSQPFENPVPHQAMSDIAVTTATAKSWDMRDSIFACITVILAVLTADWVILGGFKLGLTISYLLLFTCGIIYAGKSKAGFKPFPVICGAVSAAASVIFTLHNDPTVNFLWIFGIVFLLGIFICGFYFNRLRDGYMMLGDSIITAVGIPIECIADPFRAISCNKSNGKSGKAGQIIIGVIIAIPLLAVTVSLLVSSDAAFEGLISSIFSDIPHAIAALVIGIIITPFIFSLLFAVRKRTPCEKSEPRMTSGGKMPAATAITVLSIMSAFYLAYLLSQLAYFFNAFSGILPSGYKFSPADYARRGFFEMCAVCGINLLIIFLIAIVTKRDTSGKLPIAVRMLSLGICIFSLTLSVTVLAKMKLYVERFGLTRLRLLVSVFIIFIAISLIAVALRMILHRFPYMKAIILTACIIGLLVGYGDIDSIVARYNIEAYRANELKTIDIEHLGTLSDGAVPYLIELLDDSDAEIRERAAAVLISQVDSRFDIHDDKIVRNNEYKFYNYNVSEDKANKLLYDNYDKIYSIHNIRIS